jgi:hypothetical protein
VARASAWRVRRTDRSVPSRAPAPPPLPEQASTVVAEGWVDGYLSAVEWRFADGRFAAEGPATAWTRCAPRWCPTSRTAR